uniref:Uncharacterized protein n=1 Tax=Podoviridae sp. ctefc32 TaxID=2827742 RepID=A0A8S5T2Y9_9CAUD|nr:MAG TPA: hypothetical protein [Podoviridae sp. ctefc32]
MNNKTAQQLIEELNLEDELFKSHYYPVMPEAFDDSEVYDGTMKDYLLDMLSEKFGYSAELEQLAGEIMEILADRISLRIMENDKNYQEDYEASEEAWRQR